MSVCEESEHTMRWVETVKYWGPDRRVRRRLRLIDNRILDRSTPLPSLATSLRRLRVLALTANNQASKEAFHARAEAIATLAQLHAQDTVSAALKQACQKLQLQDPNSDCRFWLEAELDRLLAIVADAALRT